MTRVVIRNGRMVTAADDCVADILIEDGRIRTISIEVLIRGALAAGHRAPVAHARTRAAHVARS